MNDHLFIERSNEPYSKWYALPDVGFVEHFQTGRVIAMTLGYVEWHEFKTVQEAKDWLLVKAVALRMTK